MKDRLNQTKYVIRWWVCGLALFMLVALSACGSGNNDSASSSNSGMSLLSSRDDAVAPSMGNPSRGETQMAESPAANTSKSLSVAVEAQQASTTSGVGSVGATAADISGYDRKLIYNANVVLQVEDYGSAQSKLLDMVTLAGGYMLNFNDTMSEYEAGGNFVIKVPSTGFQPFVNRLDELKKKDTQVQRNINGKDVTEEYVDIASRLKAKQVVEARLLDFMEKATDTKNLLQFSNELADVQEEIEAIKGRMRYIDQNVAYSTIEIRMYEKKAKANAMIEDKERNVLTRAGEAMASSGRALLTMLEGLFIVLAGAVPIVIALVLVAALIWLIYRKTRYVGPHQRKSSYVTTVEEVQEVQDPKAEEDKKD